MVKSHKLILSNEPHYEIQPYHRPGFQPTERSSISEMSIFLIIATPFIDQALISFPIFVLLEPKTDAFSRVIISGFVGQLIMEG